MELDQFRDVDLVIDYANYTFIEKQFVSQGDYKGRTLTVLVTNKGVVGEVPGLMLNLNWHNEASGLTDLSAFSVLDKANSIYRIEYPQNMMTPGKVIASIQVIQDGKVTNLKQFELTVQNLAGQPIGIVEKAEFSALVAVLADSNKFRTDIETLDVVKADKKEVNNLIGSIGSGTPKEIFTSESELKNKYPNGADAVMLVTDAGGDNGYVYFWNGTDWNRGSLYQARVVADKSIVKNKLDFPTIIPRQSDINLANSLNTYYGKYVNYTNGGLSDNDEYCYVVVPVSEISNLFIYGTNQQGCFKDVNGVFIKGYINLNSMPTIPSNAHTIWQTVKISEYSQFFIGNAWNNFVKGDLIDNSNIPERNISPNKSKVTPFFPDINFFEQSTVTEGYYVNYSNGQLVAATGYFASDYIEIDSRLRWTVLGTNEQLAIYDSFKVRVGGVINASALANFDLPDNYRYIRLTGKTDEKDGVQVKPTQKLADDWFSDDNIKSIGSKLDVAYSKEITVADSGADYTTLRAALANAPWKSLIKLYKAIRLTDEYTEEEIKNTDFYGYILRNDLTIVGFNNANISADLPDNTELATVERVSTLHISGNATLRDLSVTGGNVRYAIHCDDANAMKVNVENLHVKKENKGKYCQALGAGTYANQQHFYKNCTFETEWTGSADIPASYHTNNNFSQKSSIKLEDCRFLTNGSQYGFRLGGMKSNQLNTVDLIGNRLSTVLVKEERLDGVGLDFLIRGRGNRPLTFKQQSQSGTASAQYDFVEDIEVL